MDGNAATALDLPVIAERLAAAAATPHGVELARGLTPSPQGEEVARRQALTREAIALLDEAAEPPLHGIHDVRRAAARTVRGGVLAPNELAEVGATIAGGLAAGAVLAERRTVAPLLAEAAAGIDRTLAPLADEIRRCVEDDGSALRDTASPLLRRLRKERRAAARRVADELRQLAQRPGVREHLQEGFVTQRGGRPVLAVKASARSSVRGIVHDASGSGQTLFVEPFEVVELNNRQSEAAAEERDEVERILRELSAAVGDQAGALTALVEATSAIDLALACGALSRGWRGAAVEISDEVRLLGAKHPLLDPATAVPIDLDLESLRALVISGPNTGGKTVALKTLGLAVLLHQSGLRPPAEIAVLPIFDAVLVDIGDEQSIERSLSTFSAHISNLIAILAAATERSLVLIDELASDTDPVEGSALAQALLERLARQARLTVVTTHYPELKEWASGADGAANAATAIDPVTHEPLYRIALGRPGTSHALQTAERLGVDRAVVADARGRVAPERLRVAELLAEAEAAERAAATEHEAAEQARAEARAAAERAREREAALEDEIHRVRESAQLERERAAADAERDLAAARAELAALRKEIRDARRREKEARRAAAAARPGGAERETRLRAERERDRRLGAASAHAARAERELRALAEPLPAPVPLAIGDPVVDPALGVRGTIVAIDGDDAEVVGATGQRVRIALARLRPDAQGRRHVEAPPVQVRAMARGDVSDELDVRGQSAQEAREAVRAFVDAAALAGLAAVRVVHGRGTGAVRKAVRAELARHPLVGASESDSADGATVATIEG